MCPSSEFFRRTRPTTDDFEVVTQRFGNSRFDPEASPDDYATGYMEFTDTAPTIFHAVDYLARKLEDHGFMYLSEREAWTDKLAGNSRFYTIRNGTSIIAFVKGKQWRPSNGASITGTHIDSLTCVVKPVSIKPPVDNFELIGVAPYSGGFNETWWDRDLGIGGRLVLRSPRSGIYTKLVRIPHPVARIATLAPHFGTPSSPPFNPETQKVPFIGLAGDPSAAAVEPTAAEQKSPVVGKHSLRLLRALAREAGVSVADILEVELHLYDTHPATLGGLDKEFMFAPRIDDKACTYSAMFGLMEAADSLDESENLAFAAAYDYEEVGSLASTGARGNFLEASVERILGDRAGDATKAQFYANSFFLSADVTHAVNPNFDNVYLENHKPLLNKGITISRDPNGNMISDAISTAFVNEVAKRTGNVVQQFQIRNDSRSGGTIGPALAAKTGLRGVDIGIAQLSMHSVRATMGSKDVWLAVRFFKSFNMEWRKVDAEFRLGQL